MSLSFVYPPILSASDRKYGVVQVDDCVLGRRKLDVVNLATTMHYNVLCQSNCAQKKNGYSPSEIGLESLSVNERQAKMPVDQSQTLYKCLRTHLC